MSFNPQPSKPKLELPRGACDAHFHVFGPQKVFPLAGQRSYTPDGDAPKAALPDDAVLVDLLSEIAPSEREKRALLVGNPQRFYGFQA